LTVAGIGLDRIKVANLIKTGSELAQVFGKQQQAVYQVSYVT